jgi:predicted lipoprotein with Yx(FWY)xxD motif
VVTSEPPAETEPPTTVPATTEAVAATEAPATTEAAAATEAIATPAGVGLSEATINVADTETYGPILVDGNGMALYIFTRDTPDTSNCKGDCLVKWPPLLTQGSPTLGEGVDPAMVGAATLEDGSQIVTYNHWPLYYWYEDFKAGDINGQAVGDVWWVISPAGEVIKTAPPEGDAAATQAPAGTPAPAAAGDAVEASLQIANDPALGQILVDANGMALYMFTKDEADKSNCTGDCLTKWPPLLTQGEPALGEGIDPALVGFTTLADGSQIVTYNHMPLYYWYEDLKAGDTAGQGVGEVWYLVAPNGTPVGLQQPTAQPTQKPPKDDSGGGGYDY